MSGQQEHPTPGVPSDPLLSQGDTATTTVLLDRVMESVGLILRELDRQGLRAANLSPTGGEDRGLDGAYRNGRFGAVPASSEAIACLRETAAAAETGDDECAVCCEGYKEGDKIKTMPCSHGFHEACILRWLGISRLCPLCRFALQAEAGSD